MEDGEDKEGGEESFRSYYGAFMIALDVFIIRHVERGSGSVLGVKGRQGEGGIMVLTRRDIAKTFELN